ncbi:MAG: membrane integrity-associated transporter subunit PqiC [Alphaproteobacteria bacterium]|nr:membrane integrity-associated transporter subunit PqiC [Alphaproteobacteria bacterium]
MKKIVIMLFMIMMSGCMSSKPNFYQPIGVKESKVSYKDFKDTIRISNVMLPNIMARPQITTLGKEDYILNIDEFNRWGGSVDKLIQQAINDNLSNIFENAMVENQSGIRKNFKYDVAIEFKDLIGRLDEYAKLDASYFIRDKNGKLIKSRNFYKANAFEGGYDEYVNTLSLMIGELSDAIANDIVNLK